MNLTQIPSCFTCNGKTLSTADKNLLAKLQTKYDFDVTETGEFGPILRRNRVTGVSVDNLNPLVAALVDFIYACYNAYEFSGTYTMTFNNKEVAIGTFDRVKYLVLKLDSVAYGDLVD
jgi:hypothetical protein